MASLPKINCDGVALVVVCTVALTAKAIADRIPSHGLSSFDEWTENVRIIFPIVWCTRSIIEFAYFQTAFLPLKRAKGARMSDRRIHASR